MVKFQQLFDTIIIIKGKVILMGLFGNIIKPLQGKLTTKQEERVKNKLKQKHHLSKHK